MRGSASNEDVTASCAARWPTDHHHHHHHDPERSSWIASVRDCSDVSGLNKFEYGAQLAERDAHKLDADDHHRHCHCHDDNEDDRTVAVGTTTTTATTTTSS